MWYHHAIPYLSHCTPIHSRNDLPNSTEILSNPTENLFFLWVLCEKKERFSVKFNRSLLSVYMYVRWDQSKSVCLRYWNMEGKVRYEIFLTHTWNTEFEASHTWLIWDADFEYFFSGFILDYISHPVVNSFTTTSALTIAEGQLKVDTTAFRHLLSSFKLELENTLELSTIRFLEKNVAGEVCVGNGVMWLPLPCFSTTVSTERCVLNGFV